MDKSAQKRLASPPSSKPLRRGRPPELLDKIGGLHGVIVRGIDSTMKTLDLLEAAEYLRLHPDTLQRRAAAGEIPGAKPGKRWVFLDVDLAEWLRSHYRTQTKQPEQTWDSSAATESITSRSSVTDAELSALLRPATKSRRRNSKTTD